MRKIATYLEINAKDMKKLMILAVVLAGLALSSCHRNACPAFSQAPAPASQNA